MHIRLPGVKYWCLDCGDDRRCPLRSGVIVVDIIIALQPLKRDFPTPLFFASWEGLPVIKIHFCSHLETENPFLCRRAGAGFFCKFFRGNVCIWWCQKPAFGCRKWNLMEPRASLSKDSMRYMIMWPVSCHFHLFPPFSTQHLSARYGGHFTIL